MGLSVLTAQWYSIRSQTDSQSNYLLDDAHRVSDLLLASGNPLNWYASPSTANSSGYGMFGTRIGILNITALNKSMDYINTDPNVYNQTQQLLSISSDFYIQINVTPLTPGAPLYPSSSFRYISIGHSPANMHPTQVSNVVRDIVIPVQYGVTIPPTYYYYYGTMTVTMWTNKSTI